MSAVRESAGLASTPRVVSRLVVLDDCRDRVLAAELAIHLLAQLPPGITASLPASVARRRLVQRLVTAYGVGDRIEIRLGSERPIVLDDALVIDGSDRRTPAELLGSIDTERRQPAETLRRRPPVTADLLGHRVAVATNIPIHYRTALFERLEQRLAAEGAEFRALFLSGVPRDRGWINASTFRFSHEFVESYDIGRGRGRRLVPRSVNHVLDRFDPTIVLSGGFSPLVSGRVARWCARRRAAFGIWSGEIPSRPTARSALRRRQRWRLARGADFAIAYGWESATYLRSLREDLPIVLGRNSTVTPEASRRTSTTPVELLVVSRAERGKALDLLVDAVLALREQPCRLTLIGDGPELPALKARAGASSQIRFLGALPHAAVLDEYRRADAFLFPSQYDVFGLVLVEAMAAGLAVITSDKPGAVADIGDPGSNCLLVREPSPEAWTLAIRRVVDDPSLLRRLGDAACRTVRDRWTIDHAAEAMVAGLRLGALALHEPESAK